MCIPLAWHKLSFLSFVDFVLACSSLICWMATSTGKGRPEFVKLAFSEWVSLSFVFLPSQGRFQFCVASRCFVVQISVHCLYIFWLISSSTEFFFSHLTSSWATWSAT